MIWFTLLMSIDVGLRFRQTTMATNVELHHGRSFPDKKKQVSARQPMEIWTGPLKRSPSL